MLRNLVGHANRSCGRGALEVGGVVGCRNGEGGVQRGEGVVANQP